MSTLTAPILRNQLTKLVRKEISPMALINNLAPGVKIGSVNNLLNEINEKYGLNVAKEFSELVLKNKLPLHRQLLITFFKTKSDSMSRQFLSKLEKIQEILSNPECQSCQKR